MVNEYYVKKLIADSGFLDSKIKEFELECQIKKQSLDGEEILGHMQKAEHNLLFVLKNIDLGFYDWVVVGCYYACYHAALSLLLSKGFSSKNHAATLCLLIKEYYSNDLSQEDIELFSSFLDYQDILFYVSSKTKREKASCSSKILFSKKEVKDLHLKTVLFVNKCKDILGF